MTSSKPVTLNAVEPQLFVSNLSESRAFFVQKLGFDLIFEHGDPAFYAQVGRDGIRLNLREVEGPVFDAGFRSREADALAVTITLDDAAALYEEFGMAGVEFHQELRREEWGATTFIVSDPDGNLLAFAS